MHHLTTALKALDTANVEPGLVKEVFQKIEGLHPEDRTDTYEDLKDVLVFGCPSQGIAPAELLEALAQRTRKGDNIDVALKQIMDTPPVGASESQPTPFAPSEARDKLFALKPGPLENTALPHRTQRSLKDGLEDITQLTHANSQRGDIVSEGAWVYDPASSTWYSHGGETVAIPNGMRHTPAIRYDASQLSETPYSLHIHPADYARHSDKYGFVFPSNADYRAAATIIEDAQNPVALRSFISHPLGLTEFTYPQDTAAIRQVSEVFEDIRNQLFGLFGDERNIIREAQHVGDENFVNDCVRHINRSLPPGFAIRYYPRGSDIEF
jgi:hypothetical protein